MVVFEFIYRYADTIFPLITWVILSAYSILRREEKLPFLNIYLVLSIAILGYSNYLADRSIPNSELYHFYSLIELVLVIKIIDVFLPPRVFLSLSICIIYSICWLLNLVYLEPLNVFNSNSAGLAEFLIMVRCYVYFYDLVRKTSVENIYSICSFWIVSGLLINSTVCVILDTAYKYFDIFDGDESHLQWQIEVVANFIRFSLISYGVICCYRRTK